MEPVPFYSDTQSECSKAGHKLIGQDSNPLFVCFACKVGHLKDRPKIVYCEICNSCYHEDCRYYKPEIRHPFHLSHPLTLVKGHYSRLNDIYCFRRKLQKMQLLSGSSS
ncbi:unnamed protein product [Arabis nemorensis]|uniref:DC1 domain-containing protein n=1 Tax=Arabis nemorensis TaxID=586526 RepID=A0A565BH71_9BRAS|nr:unnamed protein product [Arabis nemorensis]